jgi:hypothetical protein
MEKRPLETFLAGIGRSRIGLSRVSPLSGGKVGERKKKARGRNGKPGGKKKRKRETRIELPTSCPEDRAGSMEDLPSARYRIMKERSHE